MLEEEDTDEDMEAGEGCGESQRAGGWAEAEGVVKDLGSDFVAVQHDQDSKLSNN